MREAAHPAENNCTNRGRVPPTVLKAADLQTTWTGEYLGATASPVTHHQDIMKTQLPTYIFWL